MHRRERRPVFAIIGMGQRLVVKGVPRETAFQVHLSRYLRRRGGLAGDLGEVGCVQNRDVYSGGAVPIVSGDWKCISDYLLRDATA